MFILLEKWCCNPDSDSLSDYDAVAYTEDESVAIRWVLDNQENRAMKYCPDHNIKLR